MIRNACGSRISRSTWDRVRPTAYAASDWPRGSAATPARMISAMITQLYAVRPMTRYHSGGSAIPTSGSTRAAK